MSARLTERQEQLLEKLARKIVELRMSAMAIFILESIKPLSYVSSQVMVFFEPIVQTFFEFRDYDTIRETLEYRENVEYFIRRIETLEDEQIDREKQRKKEKRRTKGGGDDGTR
jgi:hypothetical protein